MENIGREPYTVHGSMHGSGYSGNTPITTRFMLDNGRKFSDDFHVFGIEWGPAFVKFLVDGVPYQKVTPDSLPPGTTWVFDKPFYLLLNLAVGGNWPGNPDSSTVFPQVMLVDYVRVWQLSRSDAGTASSTSLVLPGIVQAEDYDDGGEGSAYHDTEPENLGGAYRLQEGVDIQSLEEGGLNVGWARAGEWLN